MDFTESSADPCAHGALDFLERWKYLSLWCGRRITRGRAWWDENWSGQGLYHHSLHSLKLGEAAERWILHWLGQTNVGGVSEEEMEACAVWMRITSKSSGERPNCQKFKQGGGSFPPSPKEVPISTAFVDKDIRGAHIASLVSSSLPSNDENRV